jgi:hypothetical protein
MGDTVGMNFIKRNEINDLAYTTVLVSIPQVLKPRFLANSPLPGVLYNSTVGRLSH